MEDQRGGSRIPLETRITVRSEAGDDERVVELTSRDLNSNAISLAVAVDDPIAKDFHHIFEKKESWLNFPARNFNLVRGSTRFFTASNGFAVATLAGSFSLTGKLIPRKLLKRFATIRPTPLR
jgi:hypothetical protein